MELARGVAEGHVWSLDAVTGAVVDTSVKLHTKLGPGLLESVYEVILARELARRGLLVERQKPVSFEYDGIQFEDAFRTDLLVNGTVVVEIKSMERALPVHSKQLLTYLRIAANSQRSAPLRISASPRESDLTAEMRGDGPDADGDEA